MDIEAQIKAMVVAHGARLADELSKAVRSWANEQEAKRPAVWPFGEPPPGMMPAFVPMPPGTARGAAPLVLSAEPTRREVSDTHKEKLRANLKKAWKARSESAAAARAEKERAAEDAIRQKLMREMEAERSTPSPKKRR